MKNVKYKKTFFILISIILVNVLFAYINYSNQMENRMEKIKSSPNYKNGKFFNTTTTSVKSDSNSMFKGMWKFFFKSNNREPKHILKTQKLVINKHKIEQKIPRITWMGHSTLLIELNKTKILVDPVFSDRASMFSFAGPKKFKYTNQFQLYDLPEIDILILTHDHYDHLDRKTIEYLHPKVKRIYTPLGVGKHLLKWGIEENKIIEADWWDEITLKKENITLACTPARHFSGRGITDRFKTLWCSWVVISEQYRFFLGGDGGYSPHFKKIGEKYGPFDLCCLENGAYSIYWPEIHCMPEETVQAHLDLKGKILMPIHWAKFNLSLHSWDEPIKRLLIKAEKMNVQVTTPPIGASFSISDSLYTQRWWEN